ncbi:hypothetical protein C8R44DRAFT_988049 [Mycena epipterygia]|nr:hypothetical protein C8R44DRAFT_988049 [Mycena epipterygia]
MNYDNASMRLALPPASNLPRPVQQMLDVILAGSLLSIRRPSPRAPSRLAPAPCPAGRGTARTRHTRRIQMRRSARGMRQGDASAAVWGLVALCESPGEAYDGLPYVADSFTRSSAMGAGPRCVELRDMRSVHVYMDMAQYEFELANGTRVRTCPAAMGFLFTGVQRAWASACPTFFVILSRPATW